MEILNSELKIEIDRLGSSVSFSTGLPAEKMDEVKAPEGTLVWKNSFATLAVIPVGQREQHSLQDIASRAKDWMYRHLRTSEDKGIFLDGYLVFALSDEPDLSERSEVLNLETDTSVCRKHIIWPVTKSWNKRLEGVTTLGLPVTSQIANAVEAPLLPDLAVMALQLYTKHKSYEKAATKLKEQVTTQANEKDTNVS